MNIILVCYAGMSTSMLVEKMKISVEEQDLDWEIEAIGSTVGIEQIEESDEYDMVLVGPQARYSIPQLQEICDNKKIPLRLIPPALYGKFNGDLMIDFVNEILGEWNAQS